MVGIYLSGTGNTKYCIEKLVSLIHSSAKAIPMESPEAISAIQQNEEIYIGYPSEMQYTHGETERERIKEVLDLVYEMKKHWSE